MRNSKKMTLVAVGMAFFLLILILIPYPKAEISSILFLGLILWSMLFAVLWLTEIAYKHTTHLSGFGLFTTLYQTEPVDQCELNDKSIEDGGHMFYKYLNKGCQLLAVKGGGIHGQTIVRDDAIDTIPGDDTNVWIRGVPEYYMMNAPPGSEYHPLEGLPVNMYNMIIRSKFNPKAPIGVVWKPKVTSKNLIKAQMEDHFFESLMEQANKEKMELYKQLDSMSKGSTRQADAHERTMRAYSPTKYRDKLGRERYDNGGNEE